MLDKLGQIVYSRGDASQARKFDEKATKIPLTQAEIQWLRQAIKSLIRRLGEYNQDPEAAPSLPQITMDDLPPLE